MPSTLHKCLCLLLALLSPFTFDGFVDLSSEVLCVDRSLYVKCFFLPFYFRLNLKCFIDVVAASTSAASSLTREPLYTPRKITARTAARKCGIGMVSKLWLHFFFFLELVKNCSRSCVSHGFLKSCIEKIACIQYSKCLVLQSMTEFLLLRSVPYFSFCLGFNILTFFSVSLHVQFNYVLIILLQEVH